MKKFALRFAAVLSTLAIAAPAFAQEAADPNAGVKSVSAALAIGIAALGGALGQGRAATAALEGIARNPNAADKIQTPLILSLALIESLVIYALLIAGGFIGPLG